MGGNKIQQRIKIGFLQFRTPHKLNHSNHFYPQLRVDRNVAKGGGGGGRRRKVWRPLCVAKWLLTATTVTRTMRGDLNASNEQRGKVGDWWWRMSNATTPCCFPTPALPHFLLSSLPPGLSPTEEKKDGWRLSNNAHVAECLISASMKLLRHFLLISKSRGPFLTKSSDFLLLFFLFFDQKF